MEEEMWEFVVKEIVPVLGSGVETVNVVATQHDDYIHEFFLVIKNLEINEVCGHIIIFNTCVFLTL